MKDLIMTTMIAAAATTAAASETMMSNAQLDGLLTGNTLYLAIPAGGPGGPEGGTAPFLYGADGKAAVKLPVGTTLVGTWTIENDRYCVDWDNGPKNSCTQMVKSGGTISMIDPQTGENRGTVENIVPGNPESL